MSRRTHDARPDQHRSGHALADVTAPAAAEPLPGGCPGLVRRDDGHGLAVEGQVRGRKLVFVDRGQFEDVRYIINFPTKSHFKLPSVLSDIAVGLGDLQQVISDYEIRSIAVPALGCGLGGLDWGDVRPMIEASLGDLDGVRVLLYLPQ
jgi:O-acetyl-ADP-ribose deacetylase (regulator of RNase III)